jgi:AcrR family transcriptional regulator
VLFVTVTFVAAETSLERALANGDAPTPLDALRAARRRWVLNGRVDMGELAAELGISRATLYRWVGSRERLLGEVLWTFADAAFRDAIENASGSGPDYVADVIERYLRGAAGFEPVRRFIAQDAEYALRVLASKHSPLQQRSIAALSELLRREVAAGRLEPALEIDDLAYLVVRISESYLYSDVITGSEPDVDKAVVAIRALLNTPPVKPKRR